MNISSFERVFPLNLVQGMSYADGMEKEEVTPSLIKNTANKDTYHISEEAKKEIQKSRGETEEEPSINEEEEAPNYELSHKDRDKLTKKYHELCESWVAKDVAMKTAETMKNRAESDAERLKEQSETMRKCLKISRSMSKGLRIPPSDEQYLMEKNIGMYQMATNARMLVEKQDKEAKSVLDEKDLKEMRGEVLEPVQKEKIQKKKSTTEKNMPRYP